jgi:hypothetical protein
VNVSLRIALAMFAFWPMQSWVSWICGPLLLIGLATGTFDLASVAAMFIVMAPAYGGGVALRIVSSPGVLHLRPNGRRRILLGATGTITLVALLTTLPVLVFELAGLRIPNHSSVFELPALGTFLSFWGATALLWVGTFITSRVQLLFAFSWIVFGAVIFIFSALPISPDQRAQVLFVCGAVVWAGFALWYTRTASIVRPGWFAGWLRAQSPLDFGQLSLRRWLGRSATGEGTASRPVALCQYFTGTDSTRAQLLMGMAFALLWVVAYQLYDRAGGRPPVDYLMFLSLFPVSFSLVLVRRARLVWLRAGLDRAGLFAAVERHALRAGLALFSMPVVVLVTMSLVLRPDQTAGILLFAVTQVIANACLLHAGLTVTRGWNVENVLMFVGLGLLFLVMSIILQPHRGAFVWTYVATIAAFSGLTLVLRHYALRAWQTLDWRVAGPLPGTVGRQRG